MSAIFSFLFETRAGLAVLFVGAILIFVIVAALAERKTRKIYVDRGKSDQ